MHKCTYIHVFHNYTPTKVLILVIKKTFLRKVRIVCIIKINQLKANPLFIDKSFLFLKDITEIMFKLLYCLKFHLCVKMIFILQEILVF